jgi:hypothetical protein
MTVQRYRAACDASAATRIAGTPCFVTASDEDNILRIYDFDKPGLPIDELDVIDFLASLGRTKEERSRHRGMRADRESNPRRLEYDDQNVAIGRDRGGDPLLERLITVVRRRSGAEK